MYVCMKKSCKIDSFSSLWCLTYARNIRTLKFWRCEFPHHFHTQIISLTQRFQPMKMEKKGGFASGEAVSCWGIPGDASPGKVWKYTSLRCHFLHFEIILACKYKTTLPKEAKTAQDTTEKQQMTMLKRLSKQKKHFLPFPTESNKKNGRLLSENGRPETMAKNGRFPAKTRGLESLLT